MKNYPRTFHAEYVGPSLDCWLCFQPNGNIEPFGACDDCITKHHQYNHVYLTIQAYTISEAWSVLHQIYPNATPGIDLFINY